MKIVVIIPYKNAKEWLPRCLASLGTDFDAITINDHSTDGSSKIAALNLNYHDATRSAPLSINESFTGVSYARNRGIDWALMWSENKPDYITFLDADDELTPDAYDVMAEAVRIFPNSDIIQFNHFREIGGHRYCKFYNQRGDKDLAHLPGFWVGVWNKLYKAELLKTIRFDVDLCHGEDELFNLECLARARKISCFEKCTVIHHFDNPESLSKTTSFDDLIHEQRALINFLDSWEHDPEVCQAVRMRMTELWDNPIYKKIFGGA